MDPAELATDDTNSILVLRSPTRNIISSLLNPLKLIPTEGRRLRRDWRGLAELCGISGEKIPSLCNEIDPTTKVLKLWQEQFRNQATVENLLKYLEELDRFDVKDDIASLIVEDIKVFKERPQNGKAVSVIDSDLDNLILTTDDVHNINEGLQPQHYDAFVLFDDDDIQFATELIGNLEEQGFKLCVKERDLVGGRCETDSVIRLIAERCRRVIVIISPAFFQSHANKFFYSLAQSISIDKRQRKIIPCIYKECVSLPPELTCYVKLYVKPPSSMYNFWDKLRDSVVASDHPAKLSLQENNLLGRTKTTANAQLTPANALARSESVSLASVPRNIVKFNSNSMSNLPNTEVPEDTIVPSTSANNLERDEVNNKAKKISVKKFIRRPLNWFSRSKDKNQIAAINTQKDKPPEAAEQQTVEALEENHINENPRTNNVEDKKKNFFHYAFGKKKAALVAA